MTSLRRHTRNTNNIKTAILINVLKLKLISKENIIIVATMEKIATLRGAPLLVDTGNEKLDKDLSGYKQVITGLGERVMLRVEA